MRCDLVAQRVVEAVDRARAGAQHGIAELAHVGERGGPTGGDLGIELLFGLALLGGASSSLGILGLGDLGIGDVIGHSHSFY